jgi:DNA end-binding protein Ku
MCRCRLILCGETASGRGIEQEFTTMPRPTWSGYIRLSLVSVPVAAYNAQASEGRDLAFHQLHAKCHSRIRYKKVCPLHGEVANDEIVSAYEYEKGKYVLVDEAEKAEAVRSAGHSGGAKRSVEKAITIANFIPPAAVDPLFFEGSSYYLLPDGEAGEKPYALLCRAMIDEDRWALAEGMLRNRERLVLIRPEEKLLTMSLLHYSTRLRRPKEFAGELPHAPTSAAELRLAKRLIAETSIEKVDWAEYTDDLRKRLKQVIDEKVSDEETIETESGDEEAPPVINLMDALKRSVGRGRSSGRKRSTAKRAGAGHVMRLPHAASYRRKPKAKAKTRKVS